MRFNSSIVCVLGAAVGLGCSANRQDGSATEGVRRSAAALDAPGLTVGPRIEVGDPVFLPGGQIVSLDMACLPNQCLALWNQETHLVARPVGFDGKALAPRVASVTTMLNGVDYAVTAVGDHYVVAVQDAGMPIYELSANGAASPAIVGLSGAQVPAQIVGAAAASDTAGILYVSDAGASLQRVRDGALVGTGDGTALTLQAAPYAIGASPQQFAVSGANLLQRVDATTGAVLDTTPIAFTKYQYSTSTSTAPAIAFDGQNYLVAWIEAGNLYTTRIRASDGVKLDPDDEFNQLTGARKVASLGTAVYSELKLTVVDDRLVYTYRTGNNIAATIAPRAPWNAAATWTGVLGASGASGASVRFVNAIGISGNQAVRLAFTARSINAIGIETTSHDFSTLPPKATSPEYLNYHSPMRRVAGVAAAGADFAVSYIDQTRRYLVVSRIDDRTGQELGQRLEVPSCHAALQSTSTAVIASNGSSYLVGWSEGTGRCLQRIGCDGELGTIQSVASSWATISLTSDGVRYLLVEGLSMDPDTDTTHGMTRLDANGAALDNGKVLDSTIQHVSVAADADPDPARRTFLVLARYADHVDALRLRAASGNLLTAVKVANTSSTGDLNIFASSDGAQFLAGWSAQQSASYVNSVELLDPTTAEAKTSTPLSLPFDASDTSATFDGATFVVLGQKAGKRKLVRVSSALELLDTDGGFDVPVSPEVPVSVASNKQGRTLLVYAAYDPTQLGYGLFGHFIDNAVAPLPSTGPTCDLSPPATGGEGGAGGGGGEAGAAGADGIGTGGTVATSGGAPSTSQGGISNQGGDVSAAGDNSSAGESSGAGGSASGGRSPTGAGGTLNGAGGKFGSGGSAGSAGSKGGSASQSGGSDSGCGCKEVRSVKTSPWTWIGSVLASLVVVGRRRRRQLSSS